MSEVMSRWKALTAEEERVRADLARIRAEKERLAKEREALKGRREDLIAQRKAIEMKIAETERPYLSKLEEVRRSVEAEKEAATRHLRDELGKIDEMLTVIAFKGPREVRPAGEASEVYRRQVAASPETPKGQEIQAWMKAKKSFSRKEFTDVYPTGFAGYVLAELVNRGAVERISEGNYLWRQSYERD